MNKKYVSFGIIGILGLLFSSSLAWDRHVINGVNQSVKNKSIDEAVSILCANKMVVSVGIFRESGFNQKPYECSKIHRNLSLAENKNKAQINVDIEPTFPWPFRYSSITFHYRSGSLENISIATGFEFI